MTKEKKQPFNSYIKAYEDIDFLKSDPARSVRLQLELLKPEVILHQAGIKEGVVCFGSARIRPEKESLKRIADIKKQIKQNPSKAALKHRLKEAEGLLKLSK